MVRLCASVFRRLSWSAPPLELWQSSCGDGHGEPGSQHHVSKRGTVSGIVRHFGPEKDSRDIETQIGKWRREKYGRVNVIITTIVKKRPCVDLKPHTVHEEKLFLLSDGSLRKDGIGEERGRGEIKSNLIHSDLHTEYSHLEVASK